MANLNWPVIVLGTVAHNVIRFLWRGAEIPTPLPPVPPVPPPPPPTRCFNLTTWPAADGPVSPSVGITPGDARSALLPLCLLLLVCLCLFGVGARILLGRFACSSRVLGVFGSCLLLGGLFKTDGCASDALALPALKRSARSRTSPLVVQRFHAKLQYLQRQRERRVAVTMHRLTTTHKKRLAEAKRAVHAAIQMCNAARRQAAVAVQAELASADMATWDKEKRLNDAFWLEYAQKNEFAYRRKLEKLQESVRPLLDERERIWLAEQSAQESLRQTSERLTAAESSKLELQTALRTAEESLAACESSKLTVQRALERATGDLEATRAIGDGQKDWFREVTGQLAKANEKRQAALQRAYEQEKRATKAEAELNALRASVEATPAASSGTAAPADGDKVGSATATTTATTATATTTATTPTGPEATVASSSSTAAPAAAIQDAATKVDTPEEAPAQTPGASAGDGQCWATNTTPCQGDVSKGEPCVGDPGKYDAQHNLIYEWSAPDRYYGPYRALTRVNEFKKGSLARKRGLCVDCFNARAKFTPADKPFGPREPVNYLH